MSKIISIFSQPGSTAVDTSASTKNNSLRDMTYQIYEVDNSSFDKVKHVSRIFQALSARTDARNWNDELEGYGVVIYDTDEYSDLEKSMKHLHDTLGYTGMITQELTDTQWEHLQSDSNAMDIYINNMIANVDNMEWDNSALVAGRDAAVDNVLSQRNALSEIVEQHCDNLFPDDYHDEFYEEDDDEWDDNPWDEP